MASTQEWFWKLLTVFVLNVYVCCKSSELSCTLRSWGTNNFEYPIPPTALIKIDGISPPNLRVGNVPGLGVVVLGESLNSESMYVYYFLKEKNIRQMFKQV